MNDFTDHERSAEFDRLLVAIGDWTARAPRWPPFAKAAALWARIEPRLRELQNRLDRVLVVGVVGGTGTGKSTLVNALVGKCVSSAGDVERPTTTRPVVVCHPDVEPSFLCFAGSDSAASRADSVACDLQRVDSPLLSAMILIDCPDPDTQGVSPADSPNRNRDLLRRVLPECDVMLVVGTAQKYKTASVADEILAHAPGSQIVFVQTHAARDHDIREDWRRQLESSGFVVPTMFFIDSEEAIARQQRGEPAGDALQQLRDFLRTELAARARRRIRRENALDLIGWWLVQSRKAADELLPAVAALEERIGIEEERLAEQVRRRLASRLLAQRQLWRASLLERVAARWAGGPFAAFVRFVNRPVSPWRWSLPFGGGIAVRSARPSAAGPDSAGEPSSLADIGISEADLAQTRSVLQQQADRAEIDPADSAGRGGTDPSQAAIAPLIRQVSQRAASAIGDLVDRRAARYAGPIFHGCLELLFTALLALLVARLGWNFFYEHTWLGKPLFGLDYLVYAALWLFVWGLLLRLLLAARLQRGLRKEIAALTENLNVREIVGQLFADHRRAAADLRRHAAALDAIAGLHKQVASRTEDAGTHLARIPFDSSG